MTNNTKFEKIITAARNTKAKVGETVTLATVAVALGASKIYTVLKNSKKVKEK